MYGNRLQHSDCLNVHISRLNGFNVKYLVRMQHNLESYKCLPVKDYKALREIRGLLRASKDQDQRLTNINAFD